MIRPIPGAEAAEIRGRDPELGANLPPRPDLDPLAMLCGEHHLVADTLLLLFVACEVQPAARLEVAVDLLAEDERLEQVPVPQRQAEDDGRLPFALGLNNGSGKSGVATPEKPHALRSEPLIQAHGILRK